jgi:MFS family permease
MAYSIEQVGYIFGTLVFSVLADRIGRKPVLVGVLISMAVLGFVQFWIENFYIYMAFGFVINLFASGLDAVCVPLVLEIVSTKQRTGFGVGMEYVWVLIMTCLSALAYFVNQWRFLRLTIFIIIAALAVCSFWLVQESLTWLISTCRLDEAISTLEWIARFNRLDRSKKFKVQKQILAESFSDLVYYKESVNLNESGSLKEHILTDVRTIGSKRLNVLMKKKKSSIVELMEYPKYRMYVLIMCLNW